MDVQAERRRLLAQTQTLADEAHRQYLETRREADETHRRFIEARQENNRLRKELGEIRVRRRVEKIQAIEERLEEKRFFRKRTADRQIATSS